MKKDTTISQNGTETQRVQLNIPRVTPDINAGLSRREVKERAENGLSNTRVEPLTKSVKSIVLSNVFTYFNLIFVILALGLALVGAFTDMTFMIIVIINTAIGIFQEIQAKKALDKLSIIDDPDIKVIRQGEVFTIKADALVRDDIVIFEQGTQICADAKVLEGNIRVNESLVTGESDEIDKNPGDDLLSGSFIVAGSCKAVLVNVGKDSYVSKLTIAAKKERKKAKGMMRSLDKLVLVIGIAIIPIGILMLVRQHIWLGMDIRSSVQGTTSALVGMIPEGLYLLADIALSVSVIKLARRKTLVHDMKCIETLARVDVLCVDKTGTITEDKMTVTGVIPFNPAFYSEEAVRQLIANFVSNVQSENATMHALKAEFTTPNPLKAVSYVPFSSVTKCTTVSFADGKTYILGAPEFTMQDKYQEYKAVIDKYAFEGNRVLVISDSTTLISPIAMILMQNNIRNDALKTFTYFEEQGVEIKVISGDNPLTVSAAAKKAGIKNAEKAVNMFTVLEEEFEKTVLENTVFGRVTPEQKKKILRILKKNGHTVAMTGDGVNDVLALKEADCSIAMASGSEVASQVSQLVLMNSDFSAMPSIVGEGRRVINNIQRSASLFLVKNIFSFFLAILSIVAAFAYPFVPRHITLISALTIGLPGFFLALERNFERVKGGFIKNIIMKALPAALTDIFIIGATLILSYEFKIDQPVTSTMATVLMFFVGVAMLIYISQPLNKSRIIIIAGVVVLFILAVILLGGFFNLAPLTSGAVVLIIILTLLIPTAMFSFDFLVKKSEVLVKKIYEMIKAKFSDTFDA